MWSTKYRPLLFGDVLGQQGAAQVLQARLKEGKAFDTSYIFAGGSGCGKTTLARILARAMLCQRLQPDGNPCNSCDNCKACLNDTMVAFTEMDAASNGTVSDMRSLVDTLAYAIPGVKKKIYLLDEAHRISRDGQDVLLKPLEEHKVVGIFCTTELSKIRGTIKSRCEVYEIRKILREDILSRMQMVLEAEGVEYEDSAVLTVIDLAEGHVREILNKLETVAQLGAITDLAVRERLNLAVVSTYYDVLLSLGDPARALLLVDSACDRVGADAVAAGLAEAAMNAYRLHHKIHTEFSHFDRAAALKVYEMLGPATPKIAEYFLRLNYVTRLHLACDVVRLCSEGSVPDFSQAAPVLPVIVQRVGPLARVEHPSNQEPASEPATVPAPLSRLSSIPPRLDLPKVDPLREKTKRSDGIGPKGSSDPHAIGPYDHYAVPAEKPRDSRRDRNSKALTKRASSENPLTAPEFRAQVLSKLGVTRG